MEIKEDRGIVDFSFAGLKVFVENGYINMEKGHNKHNKVMGFSEFEKRPTQGIRVLKEYIDGLHEE